MAVPKGYIFKSRGGVNVGYVKGFLTVLDILPSIWDENRQQNVKMVLCHCSCGNKKEIKASSIAPTTRTVSCGCFSKAMKRNHNIKHGQYKHPLYKIYRGIWERCYSVNYQQYRLYGGRGIKMCDEWLNDPKLFIEWAIANGWKRGMVVDKDIKAKKIGVASLIYSPEMCSVVTQKENSRVKSTGVFIEHNGEIKCLSEWAEGANTTCSALGKRLNSGMSMREALTKPSQFKKRIYEKEKKQTT